MERSGFGADPPARLGVKNLATTADRRALDPYGLDSDPRRPPADLVSDLIRLIAAAERHGLRPARAARWRDQLLSTAAYPPDLLARLARREQRLRGWLLRRAERTAG